MKVVPPALTHEHHTREKEYLQKKPSPTTATRLLRDGMEFPSLVHEVTNERARNQGKQYPSSSGNRPQETFRKLMQLKPNTIHLGRRKSSASTGAASYAKMPPCKVVSRHPPSLFFSNPDAPFSSFSAAAMDH
ncbi:hypothetical protein C4D60_Mb05t12120 [Musa balbisiana]|uniref:Uncharacterized protein n=1 Tax=Musa balbisiana TaxID=52838 RepID=A0A4S8JVJ9_MUSBA|nr:hypothetical protein C4D60_Mb05t12120 [Musa balbisiana]